MELEKSLKRIEEITNKLEKGVDLDESIKLYEEGVKLVRSCMDELDKAKGKICEIKNGKEVKLNVQAKEGEDDE